MSVSFKSQDPHCLPDPKTQVMLAQETAECCNAVPRKGQLLHGSTLVTLCHYVAPREGAELPAL